MTDIVCNTGSDDSIPYAPLRPSEHITFGNLFPLTNNKNLSFIYPVLDTGANFQVQLGTVEQPVLFASFNGKDWDTKEPKRGTRSLQVTMDGDNATFFNELASHALQHVKTHRDTVFTGVKSISDDEIDRIFVHPIHTSTYGDDLRMEFQQYGKHAAGVYELNDDGQHMRAPKGMPWNEDDMDKPLRLKGIMTCTFYVTVQKSRNGKKYERISIKVWPKRLLLLGNADGFTGPAVGPDISLPTTATSEPPVALMIAEGRSSDKIPNMMFCNVLQPSGQPLQVNALNPAEFSPDLLMSGVLYPEYGMNSGPATALELEGLDGPSKLGAYLRAVDTCVLEYACMNKEMLKIDPAYDSDAIADMYTPLVRTGGRSDCVRVKLGGARPPVFVYHNTDTPTGTVVVDDESVVTIDESECPRKVRASVLGAQFEVRLNTKEDGSLDTFSTVMKATAVLFEREEEQVLFTGLKRKADTPMISEHEKRQAPA